jgi:hypothetical protein
MEELTVGDLRALRSILPPEDYKVAQHLPYSYLHSLYSDSALNPQFITVDFFSCIKRLLNIALEDTTAGEAARNLISSLSFQINEEVPDGKSWLSLIVQAKRAYPLSVPAYEFTLFHLSRTPELQAHPVFSGKKLAEKKTSFFYLISGIVLGIYIGSITELRDEPEAAEINAVFAKIREAIYIAVASNMVDTQLP